MTDVKDNINDESSARRLEIVGSLMAIGFGALGVVGALIDVGFIVWLGAVGFIATIGWMIAFVAPQQKADGGSPGGVFGIGGDSGCGGGDGGGCG